MIYLSLPELACRLGISLRAVQKRSATFQGGRKRLKGKGWEYPIEGLPADYQARLELEKNTPIYKEQVDDLRLPADLADGVEPGFVVSDLPAAASTTGGDATAIDAPTDRRTRQAEARQQILLALQDYLTRENAVGLGRVRVCRQTFVDSYNNHDLKGIPWWVYGEVKSISYQTLYSWELRRDVAGVSGLARRNSQRGGAIEGCPELKQACLDLLLAHPEISVVGMWQEMSRRFESCPSLPTLRRFIRGWKAENSDIYDFADSKKGWRNRRMKAFGSYRATRFNQRWEIDSTLADIVWELDDGFGGFKRYALVVAVEVYSRMAKVLVCRTSNSLGIAAILRECLIDWGVPESVKTDNGKDYLSRHITNILSVLGIEHKKCVPFNPQQKPYVERFNHTLNHGTAMVLHPRYLGHDVVARQKIRSRELWPERAKRKDKGESEIEVVRVNKSLRQMQAFIEEWLADYHNTPHEGLGQIRDQAGNLRHLTPFEAAANQPAKRIENVRALDVLMLPAPQGGYRAADGKKGIRVGNLPDGTPAYFWHECLVEVGRRFERVFVKLDPNPALIHLFDTEECTEYLGVCECYEISGRDPMPELARVRRAEKESRRLVSAARLSRKRLEKEPAPGREIALLKGQGEIHETAALKAAERVGEAISLPAIGVSPIKKSVPLPAPNPGAPRLEREVVIPRVLEQWYAGEPIDSVELAFVGRQFGLNRGGVTLMECLVKDREDFFKFRRWVLAQVSEANQQTG